MGTPPPAPSALWSGRATTPSSLAARCSVPPSPSTPSPAPSAVTSASMSVATSSTVPTPSRLPTTRSASGSSLPSSAPTSTTPPNGFTSELYLLPALCLTCPLQATQCRGSPSCEVVSNTT